MVTTIQTDLKTAALSLWKGLVFFSILSKDPGPSRTFYIYEEVEKLPSAGLIKDGSTDNAAVFRFGTVKRLSSYPTTISSQVMKGQTTNVLVGTDSHTCTDGAFGQFATGIGSTDAGFVLGTGKLLLKVPPTLRFVLDGEMPDYLLAKYLILQIIGEISVSGETYKAMEFVGSTDATTFKAKHLLPYEPVYSDGEARFLEEYRIDVSKLEPLVAKPHSPDTPRPTLVPSLDMA
nr:isopropyl malate isomerase large subunit 1 [Tanacetum cinerariifolium]